MTRQEFVDSDVTIEDYIKEEVSASVAALVAEHEAARRAAEQQLTQHLDEARFRELISTDAIAHGARAWALRHIVADAAEVFTLADGSIQPRNGWRDPADPLQPLTPARWLSDLAKTQAALFERPS